MSFYKKWHSSLGGATTHGSMKDWLKDMGINDADIESKSVFFTKATSGDIATINAAFKSGKAVSLLINPAIIDNTVDTDFKSAVTYTHWVLLTTPLKKAENNYIAEVYTWGKKKKIVFRNTEGQIDKAFKGYLAYDLSNLNIGG